RPDNVLRRSQAKITGANLIVPEAAVIERYFMNTRNKSTSFEVWFGTSRLATSIGLVTSLALFHIASARADQVKLASTMEETRQEILQTRDQLQMTVDAANALVNQRKGDLKPAYETFTDQVHKTQTAAIATRARAERMQAEAESYFSNWRAELESINN